MRLPLLLLALLATAAAAQPADRLGVYGVLGSAAPERALFPSATDPALVVGARLAPGLEAHLGLRVGTATSLFSPQIGEPAPEPGGVARREVVDRTRAVALGVRAETAAVRLTLGASLALDAFDKTVTTVRAPTAPGTPPVATDEAPTEVEARSQTFVHAGLSAVVAVPLAGGRIAPGLGLAGSISGADGDAITAPPARWMPFVSLPSTVALGRADVTLDARVGVAKGAGFRARRANSAPVVEAGIRVDLWPAGRYDRSNCTTGR